MKRAIFTAELVKVSSAILVNNIGDKDEEIIKMYFESRRSGGSDVLSVALNDGNAIVTFEDHKGK